MTGVPGPATSRIRRGLAVCKAGVTERGAAVSSRIVSLVIDAAEPGRLAQFWAEVLGWVVTSSGWQSTPLGPSGATISSDDGLGFEIDFRWSPDPKKLDKNRLHMDLLAHNADRSEELARLVALGARPAAVGQNKVSWYVLADPEGNEFCLCRE